MESFDKAKIRQAQSDDKSLNLVKDWVQGSFVQSSNELLGSPSLALKLYNQFYVLHSSEASLCQKFQLTKGDVLFLQQTVPECLIPNVLIELHQNNRNSSVAKFTEKRKQTFYRPSFRDDLRIFTSRCPKNQENGNPPKAHRHSVVE